VDFIFDIADGTERPMGSRESIEPDDLHARFEGSVDFCCPVLGIRGLLAAARLAELDR
jgi:hypothetical protein